MHLANLNTDYSYDAVRTPWRIVLDYRWNQDAQAKNYLINSYRFLTDEYQTKNKLAATYAHDGTSTSEIEGPTMYSTLVGLLQITNPNLAKKMYEEFRILYKEVNKVLTEALKDEKWFGKH